MAHYRDMPPVLTESDTNEPVFERVEANDIFDAMVSQFIANMQESLDAYMERDIDIPVVLQRGFYLSFRYSNGSPLLQLLLQSRIAQLIAVRLNDTQALVDTASKLPLDYESFTIPRAHGELGNVAGLHTRTEVLWDIFMQVCQNVNSPEHVVLPEKEFNQHDALFFADHGASPFLPFIIAIHMASNDADYQIDGRPKRLSHAATYRSFVRDYAICDKPTGSAEIDFIMDEVRSAIRVTTGDMPDDLHEKELFMTLHEEMTALQLLWESRHRQPFYLS